MIEALKYFWAAFDFVLEGKKGKKQSKGGKYFKRGVPMEVKFKKIGIEKLKDLLGINSSSISISYI